MLIFKLNTKLLKLKTLSFLLITILAAVGVLLPMQSTNAFTPNYNPNNLIDNATMVNANTMTASAIQSFLSNIGSGLATYSTLENCSGISTYHCGQTESAAQIIYDAAQTYDINPRVILATMEKEQSLVTDPSPSASQLNCAMGYYSCAYYVGFFAQVDGGTWQFQHDYNATVGIAPITNFPCRTASNLYSTGLLPGNTVTFTDPGGTAESVTIANAATATMYCYTPYVGPINVTGYSGSYNFVYYYQLWFGSTQTSVAYAWNYVNQSAYSDAAETKPLNGTPTVVPNGSIYAQVQARNVGYQTWLPTILQLGTSNPNDRISQFYDTSWLGSTRPTAITQTSVPPGTSGTFNFILHAPSQTGTYREYFNLVANGITWLNNPGLYFQINVVQPVPAINTADITMVPGQTLLPGCYLLSPDTNSVLVLEQNGNLVLWDNFQPVWQSNTSGYTNDRLIMQSDGNLVLYSSTNLPLWNTNTQNNSGAWLNLQPDGNLVLYSSTNLPLWNTNTVSNPNNLAYVNTTMRDAFLFAGQSLYTANRAYRLTLQTDGNLVLYDSQMKALWDTETEGIPPGLLALQTDGNLVLYDSQMRPVWTSNTVGYSNDWLAIQQDGNLVLYSYNNVPLWNTATNGMP